MTLSLTQLREGSSPIVEVDIPLLGDSIMVRLLTPAQMKEIYPKKTTNEKENIKRLRLLLQAALTDAEGTVLTAEQAEEMVSDVEDGHPISVFQQIVDAVMGAQSGSAGGPGNG